MARQLLSDKSCRRYARRTGLPIIRMLARGGTGHWHNFLTADHRHGLVHAGTAEVYWPENPAHFTSCTERFGTREECPEPANQPG